MASSATDDRMKVSFRLSPEEHRRLHHVVYQTQWTMQDMLHEIVVQWLNQRFDPAKRRQTVPRTTLANVVYLRLLLEHLFRSDQQGHAITSARAMLDTELEALGLDTMDMGLDFIDIASGDFG